MSIIIAEGMELSMEIRGCTRPFVAKPYRDDMFITNCRGTVYSVLRVLYKEQNIESIDVTTCCIMGCDLV
jgi:hypothetical protein